MQTRSVLRERSFDFAARIVKLTEHLKQNHKAFELASQVFRSGTAVGALVREAQYGESRKDFIHKLHVALKEANETIYWLELSVVVGYITKRIFESLFNDNEQLIKMLTASIKTAKSHL